MHVGNSSGFFLCTQRVKAPGWSSITSTGCIENWTHHILFVLEIHMEMVIAYMEMEKVNITILIIT